ncbi:uncharacterized protein [Aegilops tauschii subsp. strangulata]|uniref:uncharacterized protein n=1 Tax=Aegilops tauschii subsp. strangulata TaxID=200361 RepID=UPI003CC85F33
MVLRNLGISYQKLVDIQTKYKIIDIRKKQDSPDDSITTIIDPFYADMKDDIKNRCVKHSVWEDRLDVGHLIYAAKDAYTSYDMYIQIVDMRTCLLPLAIAGSRNNSQSGGKHAKKW